MSNRGGVEGLDAMRRRLAGLKGPALGRIVREALGPAVRPMVDRIRSLTPEDTGRQRRAIRAVPGRDSGGRASYRIEIDRRDFAKFYPAFRDLGTRKVRGSRAMRRGFEQTRARVAAAAERAVLAAISKALEA